MPSEDERQPNPEDVTRASEWIAGQLWDAESFQKSAATVIHVINGPTNLLRSVDRC